MLPHDNNAFCQCQPHNASLRRYHHYREILICPATAHNIMLDLILSAQNTVSSLISPKQPCAPLASGFPGIQKVRARARAPRSGTNPTRTFENRDPAPPPPYDPAPFSRSGGSLPEQTTRRAARSRPPPQLQRELANGRAEARAAAQAPAPQRRFRRPQDPPPRRDSSSATAMLSASSSSKPGVLPLPFLLELLAHLRSR